MLNDLPALRRGIMSSIPYPVNRALTCGFCFTYWASLVAVLMFHPLSSWRLPLSSGVFANAEVLLHLFVSWMIIGLFAITVRFAVVILQELIDYEMYTMNKQFHPLETERDHAH